MKIEYQDKIDEYLLNRMTEEERQAFEKEVENDAELKDQLEYSDEVRRLVIDRNEKFAAMREWDKEYVRKSKREKTIKMASYWVAAIAAIFIGGIFILNGNWNKGIEIPYPAEYPSFMSGGNYAEIQQCLEKGKNAKAMEMIEEEEREIERLYDESEKITDENQRDDEKKRIKFYTNELQWLKVYALFGLERNDEAMQLLGEIRKGDGAFQHLADSIYKTKQ